MELHALRHLVFNEILGNSGLNRRDQEDDPAVDGLKDEKPVVAEVKVSGDQISSKKEPEEGERLAKLTRSERFYQVAGCFSQDLAPFASRIWHQRKRLRLQKSRELRALREKCPAEKRPKFKAKRRDFTLEILCRNNLYDNIVRNSLELLSRMEDLLSLCRNIRPFSKNYQPDLFSASSGKSPLTLVLTKIPSPVYQSCVVGSVLRIMRRSPGVAPSIPGGGGVNVAATEEANVENAGGDASETKQPATSAAKTSTPEVLDSSETKPILKKRGRKPKERTLETGGPKVILETKEVLDAKVDAAVPGSLIQRRARKGRPAKIRREIPDEEALASDSCANVTALSGATDIFAFQCEEQQNISLVTVPQVKKLSDPKQKVSKRRKRCDLSDDLSETEEQVPLKITFKRPSVREFGARRGKAIKLRVKTQTTKDNGFKIQINQPKTKNPLKFKLKTSSKLFKKRKPCGSKPKDKQETVEPEIGCRVTVVVPGTILIFEIFVVSLCFINLFVCIFFNA